MCDTYKITFSLQTPVSFIDIPTFDGLLSYAYVRELMQKRGVPFVQKTSYTDSEVINFSDMPIEKHEKGYFISSRMYFDGKVEIEYTQRWRKRWDTKNDNMADFGKSKRKVDISRGQFKSYDVPISTKAVSECWFYFRSGNIGEVKYLIQKWIHFIGKKRAQGYGMIKDFVVEEADFDFSGIYRPIPIHLLEVDDMLENGGMRIAYCAWRPPYWEPKNFTKCAV